MIWFKQNTWKSLSVVFNLVLALLLFASFYHMSHLATRTPVEYNAEKASHTCSYHQCRPSMKDGVKTRKSGPIPSRVTLSKKWAGQMLLNLYNVFTSLYSHTYACPTSSHRGSRWKPKFCNWLKPMKKNTEEHISVVKFVPGKVTPQGYPCVHTENPNHLPGRSWLCVQEHRSLCSPMMLRLVLYQPSPVRKLPVKLNSFSF